MKTGTHPTGLRYAARLPHIKARMTTMNEDDFDRFVDACLQELKVKQAQLEDHYGLSRMGRWQIDQKRQSMDFFDEQNQLSISFSITPIGSFAANIDTWKWAWANPHFKQPLRDKAATLKALHSKTDYDLFKDDGQFETDMVMAWELAAMAVNHLGALGCYKAPNREVHLFLALESVLAR